MARDNLTNTEVHPTEFEVEKVEGADGKKIDRPVPTESHIGSTDTSHTPTRTEQSEYSVRGGTSRPPEGEDGAPAVVDGDGNVQKVSPGEYAKQVRAEHEGKDDEKSSSSKSSKKKDS